MRALVVLNDHQRGAHVDYHDALARLRHDGTLESYDVIPHVALKNEGHTDDQIVRMVETSAADLPADAIVWCHTGDLRIPDDAMARLRTLPSNPALVYIEGDMYERFYKPLPSAARRAMVACDVVFICGGGGVVSRLKQAGCRDIRYMPLTTDDVRFGADRPPGQSPEFDVVLVGNNHRSRIAFKTMPGCRRRARVVEMLERRLGSRFAVFGHGWDGPAAQGPVPFAEQGKAYQTARVAVGINNLHAPYYFSDRLPISLSSGVVMVHNRETGLDDILPRQVSDLMFDPDGEDLWVSVRRALDMDDADLREAERGARELALRSLTTFAALGYVFEVVAEIRERRSGSAVTPVSNPWIPQVRLEGGRT